jgi:tetratricopeptide (TPR) repeat protein
MQHGPKLGYSLPVSAAPPLSIMAGRQFLVEFPLPTPLLRAIGAKEEHDGCMWSSWLAEWGWAWSVTTDRCLPQDPLFHLWLDRSGWPNGFDPRVLALAVVLRLRVDEQELSSSRPITIDLGRVWNKISSLGRNTLAEVMALSTLRPKLALFNFDSVAPFWLADLSRVVAERRSLIDERSPTPVWLNAGYFLLGDGLKMLRSMGATLDDCDDIWGEIQLSNKQPLAFEMIYWSEAAHCLTERHSYEAAEVVQGKVEKLAGELEKLTGLVDPLWHHQQGRLYYYAGNFDLAFAEFLRQLKNSGGDLRVAAMLNREVSNVLADMTCLVEARKFAEISVAAARLQGQKSELYKSLGRLAEISIKLGDLTSADQLLHESILIQETINEENLSPAQTLTYQGHLAILNGQYERAEKIYDLAEGKDSNGSSQPYILMGRFSLALATKNYSQLALLWNLHHGILLKWANHQTHVLPATVCVVAASHSVTEANQELSKYIRALVKNNYVVEAAYAIHWLDESQRSIILGEIRLILNRWSKTLLLLPIEIRQQMGPFNGVAMIREWIDSADSKEKLRTRHYCYPMTLASMPND